MTADPKSPAGQLADSAKLFPAPARKKGGRDPVRDEDIVAAIELHGCIDAGAIARILDAHKGVVMVALDKLLVRGEIVVHSHEQGQSPKFALRKTAAGSALEAKSALDRWRASRDRQDGADLDEDYLRETINRLPGGAPATAAECASATQHARAAIQGLVDGSSNKATLKRLLALDIDARRRICVEICAVYEGKFYVAGWSDERVAERLKMPRKNVEAVREFMFGPAGNPQVEMAKRALTEIHEQQAAIYSEFEALKRRMQEMEESGRKARAIIEGRKL